MLYAYNRLNTKRILALKGMTGTCPGCGDKVIAKCGEIKLWHWAHTTDAKCWYKDNPETYWHRRWKLLFPESEVEVPIRNRRADVYTNGVVIELQNSPISTVEIVERERDYNSQMIWILNGEHFENHFIICKEEADYVTFRWKWLRKSWKSAKCPIYVDFHNGKLLQLNKLYDKAGWGTSYTLYTFLSGLNVSLHSIAEFRTDMAGRKKESEL